VYLVDLVQNRGKWRAVVNRVTELQFDRASSFTEYNKTGNVRVT
jgi:hypothetical protein